MKKIAKLIIVIICIIFSILGLIAIFNIETNQTNVYAASSKSSDLQLMARAINRRSKRRAIRRTSSSWSSYFKSCKKFKISKYNCRSYL